MTRIERYKGTRDFYGKTAYIQKHIFNRWSQIAESFGYEYYNGPLLESYELYALKSGEELLQKQLYFFKDRGDRIVAIRPEMTPSLVRILSKNSTNIPKPIRWYSIPNLYRYEQPQKGRLREHWQLNCDVFGLKSPYAETEILSLVISIFDSFELNHNHYTIYFNHRKLVEELCAKINLTEQDQHKLFKLLDKIDKIDPEVFQEELHKISEDILLKNFLLIASFEELLLFLKEHSFVILKEIELLFLSFKQENILAFINFKPSIIRGLDYYTGFVFEVFSHNFNRALCGGGFYGDLLEKLQGEALPGIGFGLGDVTFFDLLESLDKLPKETTTVTGLFGYSKEYNSSWLKTLRKRFTIASIYEPIHPQKLFKEASKRNISKIFFLEENNSITETNLFSKEKNIFLNEKDFLNFYE